MKNWRMVLTIAALGCAAMWTTTTRAEDGQTSGSSLILSTTSLRFSGVVNGSAPPTQSFTVSARYRTNFTASASGTSGERTWLRISPSGSLTTNQTITVSVSQYGLSAGTYNGTITLSTSSSRQTVAVTFVVSSSTGGSTLSMSPTSLTFAATAGGAAPATQTVTVSASSTTNFTASASVQSGGTNWLSISPSGSLTTNRTLTVSVNPAGLSAGTYNGTITAASSGSTRTTSVSFVVSSPTSNTVSVSPSSMSFNATAGGTAPASQPLSVTATSATPFAASASVSSGGVSWLSISPSGNLTTNQSIAVSANPAGLAAGSYSGAVAITSNGSTRSVPVSFTVATSSTGGGTPTNFKLIGWNDLGMHCFDGADYSIFGVLPPYNTIHTHLIDGSGRLVVSPSGYTVTYQAINDPLTNTMNRSSSAKTNFWQFAAALGFGALNPDVGLKGYAMPGAGNTPQSMNFNTPDNTWMAEGIPITPFVDSNTTPYPRNYFPMMRLVAKNSSGAVVASTDIVLPTSDEMTCSICHSSTSGYADAMPRAGWVNNSNPAKDVKLNILRKHDERFQSSSLFQTAAAGLGYNTAGLEATTSAKPILCAQCHASNALGMNGVSGIEPLTTAMHTLHSGVIEPSTGQSMDAGTSRNTCYSCHPGPNTQCVRGVMGNFKTSTGANAMECQSCHGSMSTVATATRKGWLDEPNCQSCHTGTATSNAGAIVYTSVFSSGITVRTVTNQTFATNPNTPATGVSLYRFSSGHGGLQCEACHGSTHAEYETSITNDNVQSTNLQGHSGVVAECASCHGSVPSTTTGGPHGLHPIGTTWVSQHQSVASGNQASCQPCHGTDYRGTILSKTLADRTLASRSFPKGTIIGCYSCHNGPTP